VTPYARIRFRSVNRMGVLWLFSGSRPVERASDFVPHNTGLDRIRTRGHCVRKQPARRPDLHRGHRRTCCVSKGRREGRRPDAFDNAAGTVEITRTQLRICHLDAGHWAEVFTLFVQISSVVFRAHRWRLVPSELRRRRHRSRSTCDRTRN